jgi:hypothetical protein
MRTSELALAAAIILGCLFKILHWPGASILIVIGGLGLALFYFPFGSRTLPAPKPTDQILWVTLLCGAALSTTLCGIVFFLQRWPHSAIWLQAGAGSCGTALLVGIVLRYKHPRLDIYFDGLLIRCLVLGALAFALWALYSGQPR